MDYKASVGLSRMKIRNLAKLFRSIFKISSIGEIDALGILEKVNDIIKGTYYEVVEDKVLSRNVPARCHYDENGNLKIEIKQSIYDGAYNGVGAYRMHIVHELCHVYLFTLGFKPVFEREYRDGELPAYISVEWQTKALTGEIMIPYEETIDMSVNDIILKYGVSIDAATYRFNNFKKVK